MSKCNVSYYKDKIDIYGACIMNYYEVFFLNVGEGSIHVNVNLWNIFTGI